MIYSIKLSFWISCASWSAKTIYSLGSLVVDKNCHNKQFITISGVTISGKHCTTNRYFCPIFYNLFSLQISGSLTTKKADARPTTTRHDMFVEKLAAIPEIADKCGPLFKSSQPVELTEAETEYMVACIKHIFPEHVVSWDFGENVPPLCF